MVEKNAYYSRIKISTHGYERLKERNGWSRKTADRMIKKIYINGEHPNDIKGFKKQWIEKKGYYDSDYKEYIIYGDYIYIFKNMVLITAYNIPCRAQIEKTYKKCG